jgi:hypothetical protein
MTMLLQYHAGVLTENEHSTVCSFHCHLGSRFDYVPSLCWKETAPVLEELFQLPSNTGELGPVCAFFLEVYDTRVSRSVPIRMRVVDRDVSEFCGEIRCGKLRYRHVRLRPACNQLLAQLGNKPAYLTLSYYTRGGIRGDRTYIKPRKRVKARE